MSLQDESFPMDEFLDKLTFSPLPSNKDFQFLLPQKQNQGQLSQNWAQQQQQQSPSGQERPHSQTEKELNESTSTSSSCLPSTAMTAPSNSSSCAASSCAASDQNLSTESHCTRLRHLSGRSIKSCVSDPDAYDSASKKSQNQNIRAQNKAGSYQDIHSEYTKRRFKHVASKVGEYIANMKAEELKRRRQAQFERHRSMPDTLSGSSALLIADEKNLAKLCFSTDELQHRGRGDGFFESNSEDGDEGDIESAANTSAATNNHNDDHTNNSNNNHKNNSSDSSNPKNNDNNNINSNSAGSQEISSGASASDSIDKEIYTQLLHENERIQSYSEHLQMKLDEKTGENMRLKRNIDYLRIELTNCQDKLKQKERLANPSNLILPSAMINCQPGRISKATQTAYLKTPSPQPTTTADVFITPDTPDSGRNNNNITRTIFDDYSNSGANNVKSVATIQPLSLNYSHVMEPSNGDSSDSNVVLRQRTNSNTLTKYKAKNNNNNYLSTKSNVKNHKNNKKRNSPKTKDNNIINSDNSQGSGDSSVIDIGSSVPCSSPKFKNKHSLRDLSLAAECSGLLQPTATLHTQNTSTATVCDENDDGAQSAAGCRRKTKKHNRLRRQWLRLLGKCTRCTDQHTLDNSALQTYTQIPLLEKSLENHCRNVR